MEQKYSLFLLERKIHSFQYIGDFGNSITEECCIHLKTFDTLEEAKAEQKDYDLKTIILPSY